MLEKGSFRISKAEDRNYRMVLQKKQNKTTTPPISIKGAKCLSLHTIFLETKSKRAVRLQAAVFDQLSGLVFATSNFRPAAHPVLNTPTLEQKECMKDFSDFAITKAPPLQGSPRPWVKANKFLHLY